MNWKYCQGQLWKCPALRFSRVVKELEKRLRDRLSRGCAVLRRGCRRSFPESSSRFKFCIILQATNKGFPEQNPVCELSDLIVNSEH